MSCCQVLRKITRVIIIERKILSFVRRESHLQTERLFKKRSTSSFEKISVANREIECVTIHLYDLTYLINF